MSRVKTVDEYIERSGEWSKILTRLREILLSAGLDETVKWGAPCYTHNGKNVVGLAAFKEHAALWFFQGAQLSDPDGVLVNAQEGMTKTMRHWRVRTMKDVRARAIKAYVKEAVAVVDEGREAKPERGKPVTVPPELKAVFAKNAKAKAAFEALPLGKRREYAEHVASAKRDDTKARRIEKILPLIARGAGLHDKYR